MKFEKLAANLYDKKECYSNQKFKTALNHGLVLKKVHRVIKFNQKAWLKSDINMLKVKTDQKKFF